MRIGSRTVENFAAPYVIAEVSSNHHQDLNEAISLTKAASECGATAVKFQTYSAAGLTFDSQSEDFMIGEGPWKGNSLFQLYSSSAMDWAWNDELRALARETGLDFISSVFDEFAIEEMVRVGADALKIASFEAVDTNLIRAASQTGIPLIISTGIATENEILEAVEASTEGYSDIALLHCVSSYPASPSDYSIRNIPYMAERFNVPVGLSDHTTSLGVAVASVGLGSCIFEKHFTLDNKEGGSDDFFSANRDTLTQYILEIESAFQSMSGPRFGPIGEEFYNIKFRRSLYFVRSVSAGEIITTDIVKSIRPGYGMHPRELSAVIGKPLKLGANAGDRFTWDHVGDVR